MGLGVKITRALSKIGQKAINVGTAIGNKTHSIIKALPSLNAKAIEFGNRIIQQSGGVTDGLRKASGVAGVLTNGLAGLGGDLPVVGGILKAGAKASDLLAKGAKRLDEIRDNAAAKLDKYANVSNNTIGNLEKLNIRKKVEQAEQADNANPHANFL